jgi:hypothetical protein
VDRHKYSAAAARPQAWSGKVGHARRQVAGQHAASVNDEEVLEWLRAEWARPFVGWDFSYLRERRETVDKKTWQLDDLLIDALGRANAVLDVGTGDGRYLASLLAQVVHRPRLACATEAYLPNVPLARDRLTSLHGSVVEVASTTRHPSQRHLPFVGDAFALVMSRMMNTRLTRSHACCAVVAAW